MPPESSSDWDFSPVIRLLHRPPLSGGDLPPSPQHTDSAHSESGERLDNESTSLVPKGQDVNYTNDYPRLGDFSLVWDALGQSPTQTAPGIDGQCQNDIPPQPTPETRKPIRILRRPSNHDHAKNHLGPVQSTAAPIEANNYYGRDSSCSPSLSTTHKVPTILKRSSASANKANYCNSILQPVASRAIPVRGISQARRFKNEELETGINNYTISNGQSTETSASHSGPEADSDGNFNTYSQQKKALASWPIPPQVDISSKGVPLDTPPSSYDSVHTSLSSEVVKDLPKSSRIYVEPIAYKSAADRRVGLLTKLLKEFPDYAEVVAEVGRRPKNKAKNLSRPIHVFVDISNIMVGFHNSVKESRSIPITTRIPRLPLSFENFALILERGRRATKRVLVGSDRFAAIDEAERLGYEANILGRVFKAKHITPRKSKFRKTPSPGSRERAGCSETNSAAQERWVEQGVDEILHLKILESLVDTDEPTTIVLATGDAAEAEYSDGFMKMVERALQRGWSVELVSFLQTTSFAYRKEEFRAKWGDRFKMINLEEYIEELLNM